MKITVTTQLNATENAEKIKTALEKVFPKISFKISKTSISGSSDDVVNLGYIKEKVMEKRIKNTARYLILQYKTDAGARIMLNKQTLLLGKINFVEEEYPLGNVVVDIETDNVDGLADYIVGLIN
ncbi:MAG: RNA-binding domain-containing protein [Candidatus Nanoarchaeia archaeon]|nr:RNA-binding domain-containing protein [Candidatus Nanoarchaeia archaeon]MDD5239320.1 RNA-binding domain-containing protein [Candidatus Nanoarchaeia archaeon]